ncbi:MAG: filamentous hemagglutinin family protein [Opitutales bacterium]
MSPAVNGGAGAASAAAREEAAKRAQNQLARTHAALQQAISAQATAREAARAVQAGAVGSGQEVPNGLAPGGLRLASQVPLDLLNPQLGENVTLWRGANLPTQTHHNGQIQVTIKQNDPSAFLTWETFNVGSETTVAFDQSLGGVPQTSWVAFNQVNDPSGSPTRILGSITAPGEVYVINRNGVVFGGSSQVNLRSLTVSALPLNRELVDRGILNNPDAQFLFSGLNMPGGPNGTPGFTAEGPPLATGRFGDIVVEPGAVLSATVSAEGSGGRITLVGANVEQGGTIRTPAGQTILAAGLQVGLIAHPSDDPSLRGLDAFVGAIAAPGTSPANVYSGSVSQSGLIEVPRGNATLVGRDVEVSGVIESSTSVSLNGRIDLLASYGATSNPRPAITSSNYVPFLNRETGVVRLLENSLVRVLPEYASEERVAATELPLRSRVNMQGKSIYMAPGASIFAPSGQVDLRAGIWDVQTVGGTPVSRLLDIDGQIYIDSGASISVAGTAGAEVSVARDFLEVDLRGPELADSPLLRNSFLRGETILVDTRESGVFEGREWIGTPLADVSGFANLIERDVAELTTPAGQINLIGGRSVVVQDDASLDVSAGWLEFTGAEVETTRLLFEGRVVDIADATPDRLYDGIFKGGDNQVSTRWGTVETFSGAVSPGGRRFEEGFIEGRSGGALTLQAAGMALDGDLFGTSISGERQAGNPPSGSSLTVNFQTTQPASGSNLFTISPTPPDVFIGTAGEQAAVGPFTVDANGLAPALSADRSNEAYFPKGLFGESNFANLSLFNPEGRVSLVEGFTYRTQPRSSLSVEAANIDVAGDIRIPGGIIDFTATNVSLTQLNQVPILVNPTHNPDRGNITIARGGSLDTSGQLIDQRPGASQVAGPTEGGSIGLSASSVFAEEGSRIDVSGGAMVDPAGRFAYGDAGALRIETGRDVNVASVLGGELNLGGALRGFSGTSQGGSLLLGATRFQIGAINADPSVFVLAPEFFSANGFSSFDIRGIGAPGATPGSFLPGVVLTENTVLAPLVRGLIGRFAENGVVSLDTILRREGERAPVDLAFGATGASFGPVMLARRELEFQKGSSIRTDAGGSVRIDSNAINFQGEVIAPGGEVSIAGGVFQESGGLQARTAVLFGADARVDVSGKTVVLEDVQGIRRGTVHQGGSIRVAGNIVAESGSSFDASGASGLLDVPASATPSGGSPASLAGFRFLPTLVESSGGSIALEGSELLLSNAEFFGHAGGDSVQGGRISIASGRFSVPSETTTSADITLRVSQNGPVFEDQSLPVGVGLQLRDSDGNEIVGGGRIAVDGFSAGGFDGVTLGGAVEFVGPVDLTAPGFLRIGQAGVLQSDDLLRLSAPYVHLGQDFLAPIDPTQQRFLYTQNIPDVGQRELKLSPTAGSGVLEVVAQNVDLGTTTLQGLSRVELKANAGSIRGNGVFNLAGDLILSAAQVFPTTAGTFTASAFNYTLDGQSRPGSISVFANGTSSFPSSAAGRLNLYASEIIQDGTLLAPYGRIDLGWDGVGTAPVNAASGTAVPVANTLTLGANSLTSVAGVDGESEVILPFGIVRDGTTWLDPRGVDITLGGLPEKEVNLAARSLTTAEGSLIDNRGGGDLVAYGFLPGNGGTRDVLRDVSGFAILPGFDSPLAPHAPFNPNSLNNSLQGDPGFVAPALEVGRRVYLEGSGDLPAGFYTLLPARYALLPGAFLVTEVGPVASGPSVRPDGSFIVPGQHVDGFSGNLVGNNLRRGFEVVPQAVILSRSEFSLDSANAFLKDAAVERGIPVPRLPVDAGRLSFSADQTISIAGRVASNTLAADGRGGQVDISSPLDVFIGGAGADAGAGVLSLDSEVLNAFGAGSILIGGSRSSAADGALVSVGASKITVDNAGSALIGEDIILVARDNIIFADGARIESTLSEAQDPGDIRVGDAAVAGSGEGVLVRLSSGSGGEVVREGVTGATEVGIEVGDGASLLANQITFDTTDGFDLSPEAKIEAIDLSLRSGQVTFVLDDLQTPDALAGLVLTKSILDQIFAFTQNLDLLSYSSIDFLGFGRVGSSLIEQFTFRAPVIQRVGESGGDVEIFASKIQLANTVGTSTPARSGTSPGGRFIFEASEFILSEGSSLLRGADRVEILASESFEFAGQGALQVEGGLTVSTPVLTAGVKADQTIEATGALRLEGGSGSVGNEFASDNVGGRLRLAGESVDISNVIAMNAGRLSVEARAGDLTLADGAKLDLAGMERTFFDRSAFVGGGTIELSAAKGDLLLLEGAVLDVSAPNGGGMAGAIHAIVPQGDFIVSDATLIGSGGSGGSFFLDVESMPGNEIDIQLNAGGFSNQRGYRVRSGDVEINQVARATDYSVAADAGSIGVSGMIDASGETGGRIALRAAENLTVRTGAELTVAAAAFSSAGAGGSVFLESGAPVEGFTATDETLTIQSGASIDLSVASATEDTSSLGLHEGVLHLRARQNAAGDDLALAPLEGTIIGGSHISVEGFRVYDLTGTNGVLTTALQNQINTEGTNFLGNAGVTTANYADLLERISGGDSALAERMILKPGAEIINRDGDLILGSVTSNNSSDWNLANVRFGPRSTPGNLTLRAAGDVLFFNSLSDGFTGGSSLWLSPLKEYNALLPANDQSWSYRIIAGADLAAADFREVLDLDALPEDKGSIKLGKNLFSATVSGGNNALTQNILNRGFQVIRTGSGNIDVGAGRSLQLLNPFASIYTAGTIIPEPTNLFEPGDFSLPILRNSGIAFNQGNLGALQQLFPVQYAFSGGNVSIRTGLDMERITLNTQGQPLPDSSRQLPNNWLMRRGLVDENGQFGEMFIRFGFNSILSDPSASTTWWVDHSNFFFAVGSLAGGDVNLRAGRDVRNIEAAIPTNARAASGTPDVSRIIELGGGDLEVVAGRNIDGGVYYVERGNASLFAENEITTNRTRSLNLNILENLSAPVFHPQDAWMPTTLFLGKGNISATAVNDVLLGPVANNFLLPQGLNNRFWNKTYFSTYATDSGLDVQSVAGDVTFRNTATLPEASTALNFLERWLSNHNLLVPGSSAFRQPWLRLTETSVVPFETTVTLLPPQFSLTSFSGDIILGGDFNLSPSPVGALDLISAGEVQALAPTGRSTQIQQGQTTVTWSPTRINLSDANPATIPSLTNPSAVFGIVGNGLSANNTTRNDILQPVNRLFAETGAVNTVLQTQQNLHAPGLLHRDNPEPVRIYAANGDISGLTLFSGKYSRILAGNDITDIAFHIQNVNAEQTSVVGAGRDIIAFNPNSNQRVRSREPGNALNLNSAILGGDLQISGPGFFEVLAGRNLDLGVGPTNPDGTAAGLTSVGNVRNPFLPVRGSDIFAAAGIGPAFGLEQSSLDVNRFIDEFLNPDTSTLAPRYLAELAERLNLESTSGAWDRLQAAAPSRRAQLAVDMFYLVLRDAGRDFNNINAPTFGTYANGFAAIQALFPGDDFEGGIALTSRQIKTRAGGDINLLAPGGGITVGLPVANNPPDQGILTEAGGNIHMFSEGDVSVGSSRIFTLRGGNEVIWSSTGDIAAGSAARTVRSAPPTRVIIDPSTAAVQTDLSGLATGGGIGVLQTVAGIPPSDVDLVAPAGVIDAGDAGIRVSGNLNISAVQVLNSSNISVGASSGGVPSTSVPTPNVGNLNSANASAAAASAGLSDAARRQARGDGLSGSMPSIISVQVIGFGGSVPDGEDEEEDNKGKSALNIASL